MDFGAYKKWLLEHAACSDCGAKYADRKRDEHGICTDVWATETQCWRCRLRFGSPEKRGKSGARELANMHGVDA